MKPSTARLPAVSGTHCRACFLHLHSWAFHDHSKEEVPCPGKGQRKKVSQLGARYICSSLERSKWSTGRMEQAQEVQESEIDVYCSDATGFVLNALTHTAFLLGIWNSWIGKVK